jgi:hypothetical protein
MRRRQLPLSASLVNFNENFDIFHLLTCKIVYNQFCVSSAVSSEVPDVPVISPSSGAIFERRLVEKYIQENGVDPISGKDMSVDELIEIKSLFASVSLLKNEINNLLLFACSSTGFKAQAA